MGDRPSDIFRLDDACIGFPKKSQSALKASFEALEASHRATMEYMNMTRYVEEPEDQGDDDDWEYCNDEAIEEFTTSVVKQGEGITAIANALTSLNCKADPSSISDLQRKVSDGPIHVDHSRYYKAMDVTRPSTIVMNTIRQSINDQYVQVNMVNESNFSYILAMYDEYSSIGLDGFGSKVPEFYQFLGERFVVWDRGTEDLITIFRNLYDLRNIEDFIKYCEDRKYICAPSNGRECSVAMMTERNTARCIYPERIRDSLVTGSQTVADLLAERIRNREYGKDKHKYHIGLNKGSSRRDRISGNAIPRPYFGEERIKGQVYGFDDVEPLQPRVDGVDNTYAEAMKAKRDGKIWDERTLACGTRVRTSPTPKLTMAEEIEQRLIDKYLT